MISGYRHVVRVEKESEVSDGQGGFTTAFVALNPPTWNCSINQATARDLERFASNTVLTTAAYVIAGRFHPQITTKTRLTKGKRDATGALLPGAREFNVTGVRNVEERNKTLELMAEETVA